jgi:ferredoxin-NADP reductase
MPAPRKVKAKVVDLQVFDNCVGMFTLKPEFKCRYRSGQFLHLAMDPYDPSNNWPESRVFSIVNATNSNQEIKILVSSKGSFTRGMLQKLKKGSEVWIKLPYGEFSFNNASNADLVLIAGGTGISPFISFLEEFLHGNSHCNSIHLFYGIRNHNLLIFENLFNALFEKKANFFLNLFIENATSEKALFEYSTGIIPIQKIIEMSHYLKKPQFYLSGPPKMIDSFCNSLTTIGFDKSQIFFDRWD